MNYYLDAIVINPQGIAIFQRDKVLNYSLQQCHRDNIESITHEQHSVADRIRGKGDISFVLDHSITLRIEYISNPQKVASLLWDHKSRFETKTNPMIIEQNSALWYDQNEKFNILVETLGEVIKDYMDKDKHNPKKTSR